MELTNQQIDQRLLELPHEIWEHEEKTRKYSEELETLKVLYEKEFNERYLVLKAANEKMTVKELEANSFNETYKTRLDVIEKEAQMKAAKIKADEASRKHSSLQSIVKLRVAELKSI